jgi:hypothetical protein
VPRSFIGGYRLKTFNPRSHLFWELIHVVQHLQQSHMHPCAYLLKNVPPLGDSRFFFFWLNGNILGLGLVNECEWMLL